ncbi:HTTM domain-containing protein [Streptomyces sp. TR06-5]|uniref:HTTM domain-containing protein n=1 Tax=unclassified Streptomyces TaxID=2593676 RepID=UPI0039A2DF1F
MSTQSSTPRGVHVPAPRHAAEPTAGGDGAAPVRHPWKSRGELLVERGLVQVTSRTLGRYQAAVVRIGFAVTWLLYLLREAPHRHELYGPDGPWGFDLAQRLVSSNEAFTVLLWSDSTFWFEVVYGLALLAAAALALGWHTRAASVLFMIGVLSLQNRSVFMGDGGDNIIHLMAMYLVLTRCGRVWSLDARRAGRARARGERDDIGGIVLWVLAGLALLAAVAGPGLSGGWTLILVGLWAVQGVWWAAGRYTPGEPRTVLDMLGNLVHNATLLVIMAEVCLVYSTAGWYKIQGSRWQDGTAAYYPMKLDYFSPWPELGDLLAGSGLAILVVTYGTVMVQVAFPFTLFHRKVKNVLLALMIGEHLSIAVLLGLPFFSMAMIAADAVFLPTALLVWFGARCAWLRARLGRSGDGPAYGTATLPAARSGDATPAGEAAEDGPAVPEPSRAHLPG